MADYSKESQRWEQEPAQGEKDNEQPNEAEMMLIRAKDDMVSFWNLVMEAAEAISSVPSMATAGVPLVLFCRAMFLDFYCADRAATQLLPLR